MNEKELSKKLRTKFNVIKLRSFEACGLPDVPDLHAIVGRGLEFWIELKCVKSELCLIPFRKGQPAWIEKYVHDGGIAFVLVLDQKAKNIYLLKVSAPEDIRQMTSMKLRDAFYSFGRYVIRLSLPDWSATLEHVLIRSLALFFPQVISIGEDIKTFAAQCRDVQEPE
jgi:hypothetical protein